VPHTANDTDNRFKSGTLDTDGEFSFTFTTQGTYNFFCALHPKMTGQIIVK
jgi:plastocyanin